MIHNNPNEKYRVTYHYIWWDGTFSDAELDDIVEYCDIQGTERGSTVKPDGESPNEEVRISNVRFHTPNADTGWIFERLNDVIDQINNRFYGFDLIGYDSFQYGEYSGEEHGKYDWHCDTIFGADRGDNMILTRKLSITMLLNEPSVDFEGGEFEINQGQESNAYAPELVRGRIIAFPSFMIHRVKPVTSGLRRSIVIWVSGPKFR